MRGVIAMNDYGHANVTRQNANDNQ